MKIVRILLFAIVILSLTALAGDAQIGFPFGKKKQPFFPPFGVVEPEIVSKHKLELNKGDRIVFMGDTFAERAGMFGYIETLLQARFPELKLTFRNLGYSGDTPASLVADLKGTAEYNHGSNRALNFGTMPKHLTDVKADVIFLCVGMNDSFSGDNGLAEFRKSLEKLVVAYRGEKFNGKTPPRIVLVGPIAHEHVGGDFPNPKEHNKQLEKYTQQMRTFAESNKLPFVDLYTPTHALMSDAQTSARLTINGIHLNELGYWAVSHFLMDQLGFTLPRWSVNIAAGSQNISEKTLSSPPPPIDGKMPSRLMRYLPYVTLGDVTLPKGEMVLVIDKEVCLRTDSQALEMGPFLRNSPMQNAAEKLRLAIVAQNQEWFYKWRAVNGEYIYGRRAAPFGIKNFPGEMAQLEKNVAQLDAKIHKLNASSSKHVVALQSAKSAQKLSDIKRYTETVKVPSVEEVYGQRQGFINGQFVETAADPNEALKHFKLQEGYEINLFASERDFPLHCPLAMAWDAKGRLWVTTMPSYLQYLPGIPPNDKILILEDTKGTGKADKCTVFADRLYLPTGLEFGEGGVYVGAQPNLLFLKDTNGDDVADVRETILHGFGTGDSHHAIHCFVRSPEGALLFNEGIFHRSNVETPTGLLRQRDAGIYRFEPRSHKLETYVSYNFANPWGQVFDRWGFNFIADASGGANYNALPMTGRVEYPRQPPNMKVFTSVVRPTCGCELVSSRHFPPEAQGNLLVNNNIGFQGIKQHKIIEEGSGFKSQEVEPLLFSTDRNFRPVDIKFGPDGALYVVDWYNPLIGHMQYSIRDPGRNHFHGRIWRITAKNRPLVTPAKIAGEPIAKLLDLLKSPEDRTRYRVRAELRERDRFEVRAALEKWIAKEKDNDPDHEHHLLEAMWVYQGIGLMDEELLARLLHAKDFRARAAATRALRHLLPSPLAEEGVGSIPPERALKYLEGQINDEHPRVRLEAVVALSFFKSTRAAEIALQAVEHPTDYYLDYGLKETIATLEPIWKTALMSGKPLQVKASGAAYLLASVPMPELVRMIRTEPVYIALLTREGVAAEHRIDALEGLAKLNKSDYLSELVAAIARVDGMQHRMDGKPEADHRAHAIGDLGSLLASVEQKQLSAQRGQIEKLAFGARLAVSRQTAFAAVIAADQGFEKAWASATKSPQALRDLVDAVPHVRDAKLRADAYPRLMELMKHADDDLRRAAMQAMPSIANKHGETFTVLARLVREGKDRDAGVRAIQQIPRRAWPEPELKPLAQSLLDHVSKLDVKARTQPAALDALQVGEAIAVILNDKRLQEQFSKLGVAAIFMRTVPHNMVYDVAEFTVEAGRPVVVVLENNDIMPHNLIIGAPGSLKEIGMLAEKMASDPDAFKKGFVPATKKVLHATRMLQPRESDRIQFDAPKEPGDYVFVCTFPGHWPVMNGIMRVVPSLSAVSPADRVKYLDAKKWTLPELASDLDKLDAGRNFARGKELFSVRSCNQCHKIGSEGGAIGPDLNDIPKKLASGKFSKTDLLREIIDPSAVIDKKYQIVAFELNTGQTVQGVILYEDGNVIRVAKNQVEPQVEIKRGIVADRTPLPKLSLMPSGLLDRLPREDVLDLLAYVAAGGDASHSAFRRKE